MDVDLHLHTFRSPDSLTTYDELIAVVQQRGLDAIAVTDHNTIRGAVELRDLAPFPVIVAEEIRTTEGEIIGYFLEEEVPRGLPLEESIARVKAQGGLVGVPHPVDRVRSGSALGEAVLLRVIERIDLIEGFNARCTFARYNEHAREIARAYDKPITAGSDAHSPREVGNAYVQIEPFTGPQEFLDNVRAASWHGTRSNPIIRLSSTWAKLVKRFSHA